MFKRLHSFFNPEEFQGWGRKRNYFEGWYFKVINAEGTRAFAFIPGIALDKNGSGHSFIQVLDGIKRTARYHKFNRGDFVAKPKRFQIEIEKNRFSASEIKLDLPDIKGELIFSGNVGWPKPWYSPGIMGPFSFVPFMQCYHGIVSMDHSISGAIDVNNESVDFTGGRGYIEKDWGWSFPSAYIWIQSNHFSQPGVSLKCSVAKIPWLGSSFVGFIGGLWLHDRLLRFTTYNQTKLRKSFADEKKVEIILENNRYRLEIVADRSETTELASPIHGFMEGRIEESMTARIGVALTDRKSKTILFQDTGTNAGLEVAGKIEEIVVGQE